MKYEDIRSELYTKADRRRTLEQAKLKAMMDGAQKSYEAYLDGVDAALTAVENQETEYQPTEGNSLETEPEATEQPEEEGCATLTEWNHRTISLNALEAAIKNGRGPEAIKPFDELSFMLNSGKRVAAVCAYVDSKMARFVFMDCYWEHNMNAEADNTTCYYGSEGRRYVLEEIYPDLPESLRNIITPREMTETIKRSGTDQQVIYRDALWLPSATDVFGDMEDKWWKDEPDSFQLPIFKRERDRVKECGENGTYPWWLRSVASGSASGFCGVAADGGAGNDGAYFSVGFAPGFDINPNS